MYNSKSEALKNKPENYILCAKDIPICYFFSENFDEFSKLIQTEDNPKYYECINSKQPVKLFFDVEIHKSDKSENEQFNFNNSDNVIEYIQKQLEKLYPKWIFDKICLTSHNETKKSYHLIYNIKNEDGKTVYFENVNVLKDLYNKHFVSVKDKKQNGKFYELIDSSVYREGVFRTILSSKPKEVRPLVFNKQFSSNRNENIHQLILDSFITNTNEYNSIIVKRTKPQKQSEPLIKQEQKEEQKSEQLTKQEEKIIYNFVSKNYGASQIAIREIQINKECNCFVLPLNDHYCHNKDDVHVSNFQYIVIDNVSSKQKCHDEHCKSENWKYRETPIHNFPKELVEIIERYIKDENGVNLQEAKEQMIKEAAEECTDYLRNMDQGVQAVTFNRQDNSFSAPASESSIIKLQGRCPSCLVQHVITNGGYSVYCQECNTRFPQESMIPIPQSNRNMINFWNQFNITINFNQAEAEDFNCDVDLQPSILNNDPLTKLFNDALDGHKITKFSEILKEINPNFKYCSKWYYFNGSTWEEDVESIYMKHCIISMGEQYLRKIQKYYENQALYKKLLNNIKSLNTKLHKPAFEQEIIIGAKMYFHDKKFEKLLNSKNSLVPFTNGVYDLLQRRFRKAKQIDYIEMTVGYDYNKKVNSRDTENVWRFIKQILPDTEVRDYVLKKMAECLNGDIPNTNFMMFIGNSGANGKSQILNLMKFTLGEFSEKVEVTLLTRKRNNANEASTEKMKLFNKRFAFLSEPEDGEKINIGLLKELTGSEEIVARGLYQDTQTFQMETKLFLACNELPEIKGEDNALWRRIRVVEFKSQFVDSPDPNNPLQFKIDYTIPSQLRQDSWKQAFMNILIDYYYKDVVEPESVKATTNAYKNANNELEAWLFENIEDHQGSVLELIDVIHEFTGDPTKKVTSSHEAKKYKAGIETWIKTKAQKSKDLEERYKYRKFGASCKRGWGNLRIKQQQEE